jgi:hypothetical protein
MINHGHEIPTPSKLELLQSSSSMSRSPADAEQHIALVSPRSGRHVEASDSTTVEKVSHKLWRQESELELTQ